MSMIGTFNPIAYKLLGNTAQSFHMHVLMQSILIVLIIHVKVSYQYKMSKVFIMVALVISHMDVCIGPIH